MNMSGSHRIRATRETVWAALNDAEVLKASIPGCDALERAGKTAFTATVTAKVGPLKATFAGTLDLSDLDPPNGYRIGGEGNGGPAGFARGGATVRLEAIDDQTELHYDADFIVGGRLAQLGARLIDGTAQKLAGRFFERFGEQAHDYVGPSGLSARLRADAIAAAAHGLGHMGMTQEQYDLYLKDQDAKAEASREAASDANNPFGLTPEQQAMTEIGTALGERHGEAPSPPPTQPSAPVEPEPKAVPGIIWIAGLIVIVLVALALVLA